eukprot:CAMPEP_0183595216 /NCGR_PEP_ID=MMETSP0371-20130417/173025_1 /TAXON_ID=268820 /ORGANISM="Peridinium aciculiferum, Strain PAER-2" /LENGTH=93 /DNA_ID=CAMNT_0025806999 /DNA_START=548 /DNA_END=829 /DNA_ORIENTATION=-
MKKNMTVADGGVVNCPSQQQQHLRGVQRQEVRQLHDRLAMDLVARTGDGPGRRLKAARPLVRRGRSRRVPVDHLSEPDQSSQAHQHHPVPKSR